MAHRRVALVTAASLLAFPGLAGAQPATTFMPRVEPLTRGHGEALVANADALADDVARFIQQPEAARDAAILDDVRGVMASTSEWRWYYRDHGLMVAVPVRERLAYGTRRNAEALLASVIRRAAHEQGSGNPPVQVVFIEPEVPCHVPGLRSGAFAAGAAGGFADGAGGIGGMAGWGDCGCR